MTNELLRDATQWAIIGAGVAVYAIVKYRNDKKPNGNSKKFPCADHGERLIKVEGSYEAIDEKLDLIAQSNQQEHQLIIKMLEGRK